MDKTGEHHPTAEVVRNHLRGVIDPELGSDIVETALATAPSELTLTPPQLGKVEVSITVSG